MTRMLSLATALLLAFAAPAVARPVLTQAAADNAAAKEVAEQAKVWSITETFDDDGEFVQTTDGVVVSRTELDPCELGRRAAYCDYTLYMSDGDQCDGVVKVVVLRRGRVSHYTDWIWCDSWDDETQ